MAAKRGNYNEQYRGHNLTKLSLLGGQPERFHGVIISVAKVVDGSGHIWDRCHSIEKAKKIKEQLEALHPDKKFFAEGG